MSEKLTSRELYPLANLSPEEVQAIIRRARAEQAQAIRNAIASLFRWHKSTAPAAKHTSSAGMLSAAKG